VDAQASQLEGSHKVIEGFRSAASRKPRRWGEVITHFPKDLSAALQTAWLVVEVRKQFFVLDYAQYPITDFGGSAYPNSFN